MAFTEITKGKFAGKEQAVDSVRVYVRGKLNKVIISRDILKTLGNPIFFRVAVGSGKHAGFVALIPTRAKSPNAYRVHDKLGCIGFMSSEVGPLSEGRTTKVPHEITDDGLVIDVRGLMASSKAA